jgi:phenylalanyl-tRNA synthetase beta chain
VLSGSIDEGAAPIRRRIDLRPARASLVIGSAVGTDEVLDVFGRLAMPAKVEGDAVEVEIPGHRVDLEREVDLIEEVARVRGYDLVGSRLPAVRQAGGVPPGYGFRARVRERLAAAGLREIRPVPFASDADVALVPWAAAIRVTNPLDADAAYLRTSLVPGLLDALRRNVHRHVGGAALFEVGLVFALEEGEPRERWRVGFAMTGPASEGWSQSPRSYDVFDAMGVLEALLRGLHVQAWALGDAPGQPFHPGRSAVVRLAGEAVGGVGEVHPSVVERYDLTGRVGVAELDLDVLMAASSPTVVVREPTRFPPVRRDLAFVVDAAAPAADVRVELERAAGELLGSAVLFDVFEGDPLQPGRKSLAFALELRAADRSLTGEEADDVVARVAEALTRRFGAELRAG